MTTQTTATLTRRTPFTQIHGITGQDVATGWFEPGQVVTVEGSGKTGWDGTETVTVLVDGYRYRLPAEAIVN